MFRRLAALLCCLALLLSLSPLTLGQETKPKKPKPKPTKPARPKKPASAIDEANKKLEEAGADIMRRDFSPDKPGIRVQAYYQQEKFGDEQLALLAALPELEEAMLPGNAITDDGLKILAELPNLQVLNLAGNKITFRGVPHLAKLKNMRQLTLGITLADDDLAPLAELESLEELQFNPVLLTDAGLTHLARIKGIKRLILREANLRRGPGAARGSEFVGGSEPDDDPPLRRRTGGVAFALRLAAIGADGSILQR